MYHLTFPPTVVKCSDLECFLNWNAFYQKDYHFLAVPDIDHVGLSVWNYLHDLNDKYRAIPPETFDPCSMIFNDNLSNHLKSYKINQTTPFHNCTTISVAHSSEFGMEKIIW